jgi:hypothetical protein
MQGVYHYNYLELRCGFDFLKDAWMAPALSYWMVANVQNSASVLRLLCR